MLVQLCCEIVVEVRFKCRSDLANLRRELVRKWAAIMGEGKSRAKCKFNFIIIKEGKV